MASRKEKRLLAVLAGVSVLAAAAVAAGLGLERLRAAEEQAARLRAAAARLAEALPAEAEDGARLEGLRTELAGLKARFYAAGETSPYAFGALVKERLSALGMSVVRYQVVEAQGRKDIEFTVTGPVRSLVLFLKGVSEAEKYSPIPSLTLTVREGSGTADAVFRIGYATLD